MDSLVARSQRGGIQTIITPINQASETRSSDRSPIKRLPAELLLAVFDGCEPALQERIKLTHVCRDWWSLTTKTRSLWINVRIEMSVGSDDAKMYSHAALLNLQLCRARGGLLDVHWVSDLYQWPRDSTILNQYIRFLQFLRREAPFSQWRSVIFELGLLDLFDGILVSADTFTSLEHVTIYEPTSPSVLRAIGRTATSKLKTFNLRKLSTNAVHSMYGQTIGRVFHFSIQQPGVISLRLPDNIVTFQAGTCDTHPFPKITTYTVQNCIFQSTKPFDLRNLTNLTVTNALELLPCCHVKLSSLQHLTCANLRLGDDSGFEAPNLMTLYFSTYPDVHFHTFYTRVHQVGVAVTHPGYLISPNQSVTLDVCLQETQIIVLLERCPEAERVSLYFDEESCAIGVLGKIFGGVCGEEAQDGGGIGVLLCPQLSELRLRFSWGIEDIETWEKRSAMALRRRGGRKFAPSIFGSWSGEGAYIRLA